MFRSCEGRQLKSSVPLTGRDAVRVAWTAAGARRDTAGVVHSLPRLSSVPEATILVTSKILEDLPDIDDDVSFPPPL